MADTNDGVMDSTTSESEDVSLLEQEPEGSPEPKDAEPPEGADEKGEDAPPDEAKDEAKDEESERKPSPHDRPTMQQIREEFPDLFKKFPSLRDVYYREQEFSQIFPTIEDARTASDNAELFNNLSDKVLSGNSEDLFNAVKAADEKAFVKMADSILPTLYKISPDIHWQATVPLLQNLVRGFYTEGQKRGNENIQNAAEYLSDFIFGDVKVAKGEKSFVPERKEESEESRQLKQERAAFENQRYNGFFDSVKTHVDSELKAKISEGNKVDPDKIFSQFIRDTIVGKVQAEVDNQLSKDKAHMKHMSTLWSKAKSEGYSDAWKSRIQSAYLARAASLIPSIRAKFVAEASGTSARSSAQRNESVERNLSRREPGAGGKTSREGNGVINPKRVDWGETSDLDLLNGKITYRK